MKKWFLVLGVFFIVVMVGMSVFFILKFDQARKEDVPAPNIGPEPEKPHEFYRMVYRDSGEIYRAMVEEYSQELEAYTQNKIAEENRYQQALKDRDSRARSYLLYMVILDCVLAVLVFLSFFLASRMREEVTEPMVRNES